MALLEFSGGGATISRCWISDVIPSILGASSPLVDFFPPGTSLLAEVEFVGATPPLGSANLNTYTPLLPLLGPSPPPPVALPIPRALPS